jgi:hypothetical protein
MSIFNKRNWLAKFTRILARSMKGRPHTHFTPDVRTGVCLTEAGKREARINHSRKMNGQLNEPLADANELLLLGAEAGG